MASRIVYLDMDGVLCDFVGGVARVFHRPDLLTDWPPGQYCLATRLGIPASDFWGTIARLDAEWWAELPLLPGADELLNYAQHTLQATCVVLSAAGEPNSACGKLRWLRKWLGPKFRNYLLGPPKLCCARPGAFLVDDHDDNVADFMAAGGGAHLYAQPWNAAHAQTTTNTDRAVAALAAWAAVTPVER